MKQRLRRTLLYVPGNNPGMVRDAGLYGADCILLDLEDSICLAEKDAARFLVCEALKSMDYGEAEVFVRINDINSSLGRKDIEMVAATGRANIRLPKAECGEDVRSCDREISRIEAENGLEPGSVKMMVSIESAKGVLNAMEIAQASPRLVAVAIGGEDYVTDLKTMRSPEGTEMLFGRSMVLLAARAAGIDAIDSVYSDVNNDEGLKNETRLIKQLGFDGKSVINPRQIKPVHEIFTPGKRDIEKALAVMEAIKAANRRGSGVIALNGKMVDKPVVLRAQRVIAMALASGVIKEEALQ